jgi:hypothetical protein
MAFRAAIVNDQRMGRECTRIDANGAVETSRAFVFNKVLGSF